MDHVDIPAGDVLLRDEGSRREWTVAVAAFSADAHTVTRERYAAVTGAPAPAPEGRRLPVTDVSWLDAVRFCNLLSRAEGLLPCYRIGDDPDGLDVVWDRDAPGHRLPTEAEWEHACRAGTGGARYGELADIAWYRSNSEGRVHEVGTRAPNAWGLYDTIGNVWEWCWDHYDTGVYGPYRVFRGGGAHDRSWSCRAATRRKSHPTLRIDDLGFRTVRTT